MVVYFSSLMIEMYSGVNDNYTHSIKENLFEKDTEKIDLSNANFLPSIGINLNDDEIDPMTLGIFKKSKDGEMIVDIDALNKHV